MKEGTKARRHGGTKARREGGTKARRHGGTKARREGGTKARRHEGTKARRDEGTKGRRHEGTEARRHEGIIDADRPPVLLDRPEPVTVMALTPDGPPVRLRWRGMEQRITASAGPERIACEWWHLAPGEYIGGQRHVGTKARRHEVGDRDYFKVQDERGCWLWVYRVVETGQWFVHGLWA